ncbi:hypothetical protein C0993_004946 [Termitomyces sp. T159_Od127]|nr:hypothetical protein C0993_004946 [Termitomyces sp. T159_Od127]
MFIKPHGALYAQTSRSLPLARAVVRVIKLFSQGQDKDISLIGLPGTAHQTAAEEEGVKFIPGLVTCTLPRLTYSRRLSKECFADLEYNPEGNLIITR